MLTHHVLGRGEGANNGAQGDHDDREVLGEGVAPTQHQDPQHHTRYQASLISTQNMIIL